MGSLIPCRSWRSWTVVMRGVFSLTRFNSRRRAYSKSLYPPPLPTLPPQGSTATLPITLASTGPGGLATRRPRAKAPRIVEAQDSRLRGSRAGSNTKKPPRSRHNHLLPQLQQHSAHRSLRAIRIAEHDSPLHETWQLAESGSSLVGSSEVGDTTPGGERGTGHPHLLQDPPYAPANILLIVTRTLFVHLTGGYHRTSL